MSARKTLLSEVFLLGCVLSACADGFGYWSPGSDIDCIPKVERTAVQARTSSSGGIASVASAGPQPYRFEPIAGTVWRDRFILNFFDLDPSPGVVDWDCSEWTYDAHYATDILIRGFAEQDIGVPVFAALDGMVTDFHDGEDDRNTVLAGQPANYVIVNHGDTHYSWYWHLRKGSVLVSTGQQVRAGTQIAQVGSSGHSFMPHLHFESRFDGYAYETYSGPCRPGPQHWVNQTTIPRQMWVSEFAMHNSNNIPDEAFYPHNPPRTGSFVRAGTAQPIGAWYVIHNEPANSAWRARYMRPDGTVGFDSGLRAGTNAYSRWMATWFSFAFDADTTGRWTLELSVNDQLLVNAPFLVLPAGATATNHPPEKPTVVAFDPPTPTGDEALFCRLTAPFVSDADYDVVRYRFEWFVNDVRVRTTTNAALADAIPRGAARGGDLVRTVVSPYDGREFGHPTEMTVVIPPRLSLAISNFARSQVVISWPTSMLNYVLQVNSPSLPTGAWTNAIGKPVPIGARLFVTNTITQAITSRIYRLASP